MSSVRISFYLDNPKSSTTTIIKVAFTSYKIRTKVSIQHSISVSDWDKAKEQVKSSNPSSIIINAKIAEIKDFISRQHLLQHVNKVFNNDAFIESVKNFIKGVEAKEDTLKKSFFEHWQDYLDYKHSNGIISDETLKTNLRAKRLLMEYKSDCTFETIDEKFLTQFKTHLITKHNYEHNGTIPILKNSIISFLNWATAEEINTSMKYKKFKIVETERHHNVYLSFDELEKIQNLENLPSHLENARNWLMLMCYTGLRVSDALALNKSNINLDSQEINIVVIKTKRRLKIPILPQSVEYIKRLLNGEMYKVSPQKLNDSYKPLCKIAGITELIPKFKQQLNKSETLVPKYELISNHCFRRSLATNSLLKGITPSEVMQITGHTSLSSFEKYNAVTNQNAVNKFKQMWTLAV